MTSQVGVHYSFVNSCLNVQNYFTPHRPLHSYKVALIKSWSWHQISVARPQIQDVLPH